MSLVDLGPTLLGELGLETPPTMTGRDLGSLLHETAAGRAWEGFAHVERYPRDPLPNRTRQVALVTKDLKAIGFAGDPSPEVYDLSRDPGERHNVFDPGDRRQRELLGLLRALEARQDGGRVARATRGAGIDVTPEFLVDVTARLEDAVTGNDIAAVHELGAALFRGHRRRFARDVWDGFSPDLRARLARALCVIGSGADRHPQARVSAFEILLDLPGDVASEVMAQALTLPQPEASYPAALWFAERGDRRGLGILRSGLRPELTDWASRIAPTLARLGDLTARPWLEPRLFHEDPEIAADAISALGTLAPRDLGARLREVGPIGAPSATHPRVRLALVEAARGASDFDGLAVLLALTFAERPPSRPRRARRSRDASSRRRGDRPRGDRGRPPGRRGATRRPSGREPPRTGDAPWRRCARTRATIPASRSGGRAPSRRRETRRRRGRNSRRSWRPGISPPGRGRPRADSCAS
ncbi:MAG: hypothetical protein R3F20_01360 [Planctomycetota bacterium]